MGAVVERKFAAEVLVALQNPITTVMGKWRDVQRVVNDVKHEKEAIALLNMRLHSSDFPIGHFGNVFIPVDGISLSNYLVLFHHSTNVVVTLLNKLSPEERETQLHSERVNISLSSDTAKTVVFNSRSNTLFKALTLNISAEDLRPSPIYLWENIKDWIKNCSMRSKAVLRDMQVSTQDINMHTGDDGHPVPLIRFLKEKLPSGDPFILDLIKLETEAAPSATSAAASAPTLLVSAAAAKAAGSAAAGGGRPPAAYGHGEEDPTPRNDSFRRGIR